MLSVNLSSAQRSNRLLLPTPKSPKRITFTMSSAMAVSSAAGSAAQCVAAIGILDFSCFPVCWDCYASGGVLPFFRIVLKLSNSRKRILSRVSNIMNSEVFVVYLFLPRRSSPRPRLLLLAYPFLHTSANWIRPEGRHFSGKAKHLLK